MGRWTLPMLAEMDESRAAASRGDFTCSGGERKQGKPLQPFLQRQDAAGAHTRCQVEQTQHTQSSCKLHLDIHQSECLLETGKSVRAATTCRSDGTLVSWDSDHSHPLKVPMHCLDCKVVQFSKARMMPALYMRCCRPHHRRLWLGLSHICQDGQEKDQPHCNVPQAGRAGEAGQNSSCTNLLGMAAQVQSLTASALDFCITLLLFCLLRCACAASTDASLTSYSCASPAT